LYVPTLSDTNKSINRAFSPKDTNMSKLAKSIDTSINFKLKNSDFPTIDRYRQSHDSTMETHTDDFS